MGALLFAGCASEAPCVPQLVPARTPFAARTRPRGCQGGPRHAGCGHRVERAGVAPGVKERLAQDGEGLTSPPGSDQISICSSFFALRRPRVFLSPRWVSPALLPRPRPGFTIM